MARTREVGTLWIGGALSWMEQLCLKSFVDKGQKITLFSYDKIANVPEGVICRDGREILDTDDFIKYEKKDSFALFADYFRIHMIQQNPGMIWVDTDVYCHRVMDYDSDYVMGFELPGGRRVNNAVLGLPADSAILQDMLTFMEDCYSIAPFLKEALQNEYRAAAAAGAPVHVSQQPWGVWGPLMVTHFIHKHGLAHKVQPLEAFYPIPFPQRLKFLRRNAEVQKLLRPETTGLHLWASNKRELILRHDGLPRKGSYFAQLLDHHDIQPEKAPLTGRGKKKFDAGLLDDISLKQVARFADIGGNAQAMALAAWVKWGCSIDLIDIGRNGSWPEGPSDWVARYRQFLTDHGVPFDHINLCGKEDDLVPAQVVTNLTGFGDLYRIPPLGAVLDRVLGPGGCVISDIRKGSGGYPFFRQRGTLTQLSSRKDTGGEVHRVLVIADKAPTSEADQSWAEIAQGLAGKDGFYRESDAHAMLFIKRSDTLVVTFDNLDIAMEKREDKRPWGFAFVEKQGWSMLGVTAEGWTWFRDAWVDAQFDELKNTGFFQQFKRVVFYGASMGGYGACAFAAACPGADVVAISPQSTLDKALAPFETRYKTAWDRDFSGPYGDAAKASATAGRVTLIYDPYEPLDSGHVARFTAENVVKLRAPLLGHRLGSSLHQMGILSPIVLAALNGTLTEADFYQRLRARKQFGRYQKELFNRALSKGHPELARKMGRWVLTHGGNRHIRKALEKM
ncbi:hypothetical protein EOK75_13805 (plasmid) [Pseudorhodobacter turbinis]|uniref:Alpha 1,4-glycosyltransferase domain-containing protein n=1 Tax=Pseudorhodobacter turbinis TaxID=2500533 RepID=A0A4P8EIT0_9RHOB|nr:hypothetical protein [Pseudorhodobacter turbinis]QCO56877.1 hypothetical protein EOK75_13805 [Pseudorhodobacter turbinis]